MNVLAGENVTPQETSERGTKSGAEGAVVDTQCHAVHGGPEGAVRDGDAAVVVDLLPSLNDAGEEDSGADVCAGELYRTS